MGLPIVSWLTSPACRFLSVSPSPSEPGGRQGDGAEEEGPGRQVRHLPEQSVKALSSFYGPVNNVYM